jgi:hypothetical protein
MRSSGNGQNNDGGFVVAVDLKAEASELRRILALPPGERAGALAERVRARRERAAEYAAREVDSLLER